MAAIVSRARAYERQAAQRRRLQFTCEVCKTPCNCDALSQCDLCGAVICPRCVEQHYGYAVCRDCQQCD